VSWEILGVGVFFAAFGSFLLGMTFLNRRRMEELVGKRTMELTQQIRQKEEIEARLTETDKTLNARLSELNRKSTEFGLLNQMGEMLQRCRVTSEALPVITRFALQLLPDGAGVLYLCDEEARFVECVAAWGDTQTAEQVFSVDRCWALRSGKPHLFSDPERDLLYQHSSVRGSRPSACLSWRRASSSVFCYLPAPAARPAQRRGCPPDWWNGGRWP
jgi:hypothetical protein